MRIASCAIVLAAVIAVPMPAAAWGAMGHRIISTVAAQLLPDSLPAFVRTPDAVAEIGALGGEADRLRDGGGSYDPDVSPAHFLDLDDDGTVAGVVPLTALPPSRAAYDTMVRSGRKVGSGSLDEYHVGYLPYEIADGWLHVERDFAIWRVDRAGELHGASAADRAFFTFDRQLRETLALRDIGYWSHFVADGSQPLHVTVHFNGWGEYPNPDGFTQSRNFHAKFETAFVDAHADAAAVRARVGPYVPGSGPTLARVGRYLLTTGSYVRATYRLEATGAFDNAMPDGVNFMLDRLADGARMLRDATADAYAASANDRVGYPGIPVRDVESGAIVPTPRMIAGD